MTFLEILARTLLAVTVVIGLVRLNGLRSFSKMAGFDFALTVASGSILAMVIAGTSSPWRGAAGLAALFIARFAISLARSRFTGVETLVDNRPLMLAYEGSVLTENLAHARVTMDDLRGKLREANVLRYDQIRAVVLEPTGDVSVLHGETLDTALLQGVSWGEAERPDALRDEAVADAGPGGVPPAR